MKSNLFKRLLVAIIFIPIILHVSYWGGWQFNIFIAIITLVSQWEFYTLSKFKALAPNVVIGFLTTILISFQFVNENQKIIFQGFENYFLIILILISFVIEIFKNRGSIYFNLGTTFLGSLYFGIAFGSILNLKNYFESTQNNLGMIAIFVSIWACDTFAFIIGSKFGKNKISKISPNKSWEGAIAGLIGSITTFIIFSFYNSFQLYEAIFYGLLVGTFGQLGDFVESAFKRDADVKDSSQFIPGHGGVWDRFDSLFFATPVIVIYNFIVNFVQR